MAACALPALAPAAAQASPLVVGVSGSPAPKALREAGVRSATRVAGLPALRVTPRPGASEGVAQRLRDLPGVRYVEPQYRYRPSSLPDDALLPRQWELVRSPAMGAPAAWRHGPGRPVTVAVVDTGVDLSHPDLAGNRWTNPGEIPGNGIDDDGDGYVDDVHGWNFADASADVSDANGHGTAVAGVIAARGDNRIGIAGVAWRARVMALKVVDSTGAATADRVAAAIRFATAHGARIVNVSLNGPDRSAVIEDAIRDAQARGALVVASAGNDGRRLDVAPSYPASYPEDAVVTVGATGRSGSVAGSRTAGLPSTSTRPARASCPPTRAAPTACATARRWPRPTWPVRSPCWPARGPRCPPRRCATALVRGARRGASGVVRLDAGRALDSVLPSGRDRGRGHAA